MKFKEIIEYYKTKGPYNSLWNFIYFNPSLGFFRVFRDLVEGIIEVA